MTNNSVTLVQSVKTRISTVLGGNYSELAYSNDLSKNSFKGNFNRYGLLSKEQDETDSVTQYTTINQRFELILVDSFINTSMNDIQELSKGPVLQDLAYDIYRDLITTKAGSPATVITVSNFSTSAPETIQDKAVVIRAQFTIRYRNKF